MYYKKHGLPEESSIVLCTVTKILPNCVFAKLDEFENLEGMLHISEIAPGRIRNIRDYVRENKKIVCKIIRTDRIKRHFDLSIRRISAVARKAKLSEITQEEKAEKIIEFIAKQLNLKPEEIYREIAPALIEKYDYVHKSFPAIIDNQETLKDIKVEQKIKETFISTIKEKIRPVEVVLKSIIALQSKAGNGIEIIKNALKSAELLAAQKHYKLNVLYLGAPRYELSISSSDYKTAEKILHEISDSIAKYIKAQQGEVLWERKS